ncbi:MAG: type IV secretory system conjugative DNA transfer family protein [Candidatus Saccharibacteria bacterium]
MKFNVLQPKTTAPTEGCLLLLQVPRTNDKKALAAEQMLASLHGLLTLPSTSAFSEGTRERISFEIAVINKRIGFYVWAPKYLKDFVTEQVYAQYPSVQISEVEDYSAKHDHPITLTTDLQLTGSDVLPIKMFQNFDVDPLAAITATLAKFEDNEEAWVQLIMRPASSSWQKKSEAYLKGIKSGKTKTTGMLQALWAPPEVSTTAKQLTEYEQTRATGAQEKSQKLAFEAVLRVVYRGDSSDTQARLRMQSIIASYKQFNTTYLNGFEQGRLQNVDELPDWFQDREFGKVRYTMNIEEVATLYHLPHTNVETPFILWAASQTAEPPANLPIATPGRIDISPIAMTHFRGHDTAFGLPRSDRGRHLYIIGQTGVGKSGLLELLTISDVYSPFGFAVIDPHGDYAQNILTRIPPERAKDVIYFNAADTDFPIAFNPMEVSDPKLKNHTCSELIGVLKRMFESWGPRLEYILRYGILALLDYPNATMLDITRILTDKAFRKSVLVYVQDPVVLNFWNVEFASWNDKFAAEAVAPVLNKVGAFTANPLVRNIIGQPKSSFNIRQIMDERKILIINLSRGLVGEDNASLLGALIVTKIQMAAMSRADISVEERTPFYLYVDEFQNFATDSFATILSEARKYGLNLTVANQYTAQMLPQVKDAVFGNVGSIIAFRMSADDSKVMMRYFEPQFTDHDLVHMHNRHFVISMAIEGEKAGAFSAISLNLPPLEADNTDFIIAESRRRYARDLATVEKVVNDQYLSKNSTPQAGPGPNQTLQKKKDFKNDRPERNDRRDDQRDDRPARTDRPERNDRPDRDNRDKPKTPARQANDRPERGERSPERQASPSIRAPRVFSEGQRDAILRTISRLALLPPSLRPQAMARTESSRQVPEPAAPAAPRPERVPQPARQQAAPAPVPQAPTLPAEPQEVTVFSRHDEGARTTVIDLRDTTPAPAPDRGQPVERAPRARRPDTPELPRSEPRVQATDASANPDDPDAPKKKRRRRRRSKAPGSTAE